MRSAATRERGGAASGDSTRSSGTPSVPEANLIRATELGRLRALVEANIEAAHKVHADDFQLINPRGELLSKERYLTGVATGEINYLLWTAASTIEVRVYGQVALIRYRSHIEIVVGGHKVPLRQYWHTDSYEKRNGYWQVVWSQATEIKANTSRTSAGTGFGAK